MAAEAAACEYRLTWREPTDADRSHVVGMLPDEFPVDRLIVLPIVTDEQPLDLRKLPREAFQTAALVLTTAAEPAIRRGSPIGQQQSTCRIQIAG